MTDASRDTILQWLSSRFIDRSVDAECTEALLDIDEVAACLERSEEQELQKLRKAAEGGRDATADFQDQYRTLAAASRDSVEKRPKKAKKSKMCLPADVEMCDTSVIKTFVLPTAFLRNLGATAVGMPR